MDVYLVRHGQTEANRLHHNQGPNEPITDRGREQAAATAKWFKDKGVTQIIASDYVRCQQTAEIIAKECRVEVQTNSLFREFARPKEVFEYSHYHPKTLWFVFRALWNRSNPDWQSRGGESLRQIEARAQDAREFLESKYQKDEVIVVVTHAVFLEVILRFMCGKGNLLSYIPILSPLSRIRNASVSHCTLFETGSQNTCRWNIVSENFVPWKRT